MGQGVITKCDNLFLKKKLKNKNMSNKEFEAKVSPEVALEELKDLLRIHKKKEFRRGELTTEKIEEDYIDVLEAIEDGLLIFDRGENGNSTPEPLYTLRSPLFANAKDTSNVVSEVKFRKRVKPADKIRLMDGLDIEKQKGTYILKVLEHVTSLSKTEIGLLENEDFEVIKQLSSVF